jgi:hypothetical protein
MWMQSVSVTDAKAVERSHSREATHAKQAGHVKAGPEALLDDWLPSEPVIGPDTRVIAMGSCFSAPFVQYLAENEFDRHFDTQSDASFLPNLLESPAAVAQSMGARRARSRGPHLVHS